jgi:predicted HTH domain antitoxin
MAVQEMELDALIKAGIFHNKGEAVEEAVRALFTTRPQLRLQAAIQLFKDEAATLGRCAEIAGLTRWEFEDALADHGLIPNVTSATAEELERQTNSSVK